MRSSHENYYGRVAPAACLVCIGNFVLYIQQISKLEIPLYSHRLVANPNLKRANVILYSFLEIAFGRAGCAFASY